MNQKHFKYTFAAAAVAAAALGAVPRISFADAAPTGPGLEILQREQAEESAVAEETEAHFGPVLQETAAAVPEAVPVTEADIDAYFDGMTIIGDSVTVGFRNYAMRHTDTCLSKVSFLAAGSLSAYNALLPVSEKSVHPLFRGEKRLIEDSLKELKPGRIFISLGLNDLNMGPLENSIRTYRKLIESIRAAVPEAEIHLISMTYAMEGTSRINLNNDNIRTYNEMIRQMALELGLGYVDMATPLSDGKGNLNPDYCSDGYVHQTFPAYEVWFSTLRSYAKSQLDKTSPYTLIPAAPAAVPAP